MLLTSENIAAINRGLRVLFKQSYDGKTTFWEKLAMKIASTTGSETYAWLGALPQMREWVGDRVIRNLSAFDYTIKNETFEAAIGIPRDAIEDDAIGVYSPSVGMMAEDARVFPDTLVAGLLKNGDANKCYDGQPFFSGSHKVAKANISNKGTKKLTADAYGAARAAMMSLKNEENKSLRIIPNLLAVAPALEGVARKILMTQQIEGSDNIYYHSAELLVLPELAGMDTTWFLLDTSRPVKPFIVQERRAAEFTAMDKPDDANVFMKNQYLYGTTWRGNAGYALWQLAYMSDGTVA